MKEEIKLIAEARISSRLLSISLSLLYSCTNRNKTNFSFRHRLYAFQRNKKKKKTNKRKLLLWYFACRHSLVSPLITFTIATAAAMMKKNWWNDLFYANNFSSCSFNISFSFHFLPPPFDFTYSFLWFSFSVLSAR